MAMNGGEFRAAERRLKSVELRSAGLSYRQIGRQLGVSHTLARRDVLAGLKAAQKELGQRSLRLFALEYMRLELPVSQLAVKIMQGDLDAVDVWIKLSESRRELLGLDAPKRTGQTHAGEVITQIIEVPYRDPPACPEDRSGAVGS
jgi:hypothetical protein